MNTRKGELGCPNCDGPCLGCWEKASCEDCRQSFYRDEMHHDDSGSYCEPCRAAQLERAALDAGIPLSVIRGETKLTDHFSRQYIDHMCNREPREDE